MTFKEKIYHIVGKKTPEEQIRERIKIIQQLVQEKRNMDKSPETDIEKIKQEFYLDGLAIADENGEILESNGSKQDFKEILTETGLLNQVKENLPDTEILKIRNNGNNHIMYRENGKVYFMKTPGNVSIPEIKRITQKIRGEN